MNVTSALLDFLMNLLRNPDAAAEFRANPDAALEKAGLGSVTTEDCDAVMPVVLDYAPVIGDRDYDTGGNKTDGGNAGGGGNHPAPSVSNGGGNSAGGDHAAAVQQIEYVVKNYSYTSTDDRDTIVDSSVNQNIWALGDVEQVFANETVVASGDHAVAAGEDAWVDQSTDNSVDVEVELEAEGDINIGNDQSTNDSYNKETEIDDSFNEDNDHIVKDSFNEDNDYTHKEDNDVVAKDNELNIGNEDNDVVTKVEDNDTFTKNEDNDVVVKDNEVDINKDSVVIEDNELDLEYKPDYSSDDDVIIKDNYTEVKTEIEDNVVLPIL